MLPQWYIDYKNFIDTQIETYLNQYFLGVHLSAPLKEFIQTLSYGTTGGKRFRGILALEIYLNITGKNIENISENDDIIKLIIALEVAHSYSLIHDDLPCMDNDEYRRGQLTVWKKYGEYQAVLAGDALNTLSLEILSTIGDPGISQKLVFLISSSLGTLGMLGGQIEDIFYEDKQKQVTEDILIHLHNKKTGKLIVASVIGGAIIAKDEILIPKLQDFGEKLGLAFQIKDDILDVEGSFEETGKSVGGEEKGFVYVLGIEKAKQKLTDLICDCTELIAPLKSDKLNFIVKYVEKRIQ